jgi:hypothetical protein
MSPTYISALSLHHMQTVDAFWKASSGDMSWHAGCDRAPCPRVVNNHQATLNLVVRMWQVKVTGGRLCISACHLHVVLVVKASLMNFEVMSSTPIVHIHFGFWQLLVMRTLCTCANGRSSALLISHQLSWQRKASQAWQSLSVSQRHTLPDNKYVSSFTNIALTFPGRGYA